jgi:Asp-tRNA(Asn)/Glu-tRNA(Gln) amidotransferase A subunit family amidase
MEEAMNLASEMQAACDGIVSASVNRAHRLGSLRRETDAFQRASRRMVKDFHAAFGATARNLRSGLNREEDARKQAVAGLRAGFRQEVRALRADLAAAKEIWAAMAKR